MNIGQLKEYIKDLPDDMELDEYFCGLDKFYQPAMHITKTGKYLLIEQLIGNTETK